MAPITLGGGNSRECNIDMPVVLCAYIVVILLVRHLHSRASLDRHFYTGLNNNFSQLC